MNMLQKQLALACLLGSGLAQIREERRPTHTSDMTLDVTQSEHTRNENGGFKHPFAHAAPEVQSIYYPESKTFSKKMTRVPGPSKYTKHQGQRVIGNGGKSGD